MQLSFGKAPTPQETSPCSSEIPPPLHVPQTPIPAFPKHHPRARLVFQEHAQVFREHTPQAKPQATLGHKSGKMGDGSQRRDGGAAATQDDVAIREARTQQAMSRTLPKGSSGEDVLGSVVAQLANCRADELARLKSWTGLKKQLAVYRSALFSIKFHLEVGIIECTSHMTMTGPFLRTKGQRSLSKSMVSFPNSASVPSCCWIHEKICGHSVTHPVFVLHSWDFTSEKSPFAPSCAGGDLCK
jgi:hypothetical protein